MIAALKRPIFDALFLFTNGMDCLELYMANNKYRAGNARRKSEASSRKRLVSLSSIFFSMRLIT